MVTHPNQCSNPDPHTPHPWKGGSDSRYQCSGIGAKSHGIDPTGFEEKEEPLSDQTPLPTDLFLKLVADDETLRHMRVVLHEFWNDFLEAYAEYGPRAADELGLAGQWGDLHRKVKKLKAPLWAGNKERLTRETPRQVLFDIIGHSLLAIDMLDREFEGGR